MNVIAIGNGDTKDNDENRPDILQYDKLKALSMGECKNAYPFLVARKDVICAVGDQMQSICKGDAGGPLVVYDTVSS